MRHPIVTMQDQDHPQKYNDLNAVDTGAIFGKGKSKGKDYGITYGRNCNKDYGITYGRKGDKEKGVKMKGQGFGKSYSIKGKAKGFQQSRNVHQGYCDDCWN